MAHKKTDPDHGAFAIMSNKQHGLTKREYFAAVALQGMLARRMCEDQEIAAVVEIADALIEALNKDNSNEK